MNRGVIYAFIAYGLWGILPVFWKMIQTVPAYEVLCHRIVWTLVCVVIVLLFRNQWKPAETLLRQRRTLLLLFASSSLISINWLTYIWAVNNGYIVESSLGYFMNPLVNVLLGVVFLGERLRKAQLAAILLAAVGVVYMTVNYGAFPLIALVLAFSFGFYGLIRKVTSLNALEGLGLEMVILLVPAMITLIVLDNRGMASFAYAGRQISILLMLTGLITAVPLGLFASAARRVRLTTMGLIQYITPSLHFVFGVFVYREPFNRTRLTGFIIIWIALLIYTIESMFHLRLRFQHEREKYHADIG